MAHTIPRCLKKVRNVANKVQILTSFAVRIFGFIDRVGRLFSPCSRALRTVHPEEFLIDSRSVAGD